jgi:drug/metabolite transporter (DMT)-like permease
MAADAPIRARADFPGYLAVLVAATFWATSGIFIKLIMSAGEISALSLAFWRDLGAFLVFFILHLSSGGRLASLRRADWPWALALGASLGLFHVGLNFAVFLNGAAVTTIQQASMPAIVLLFERCAWGVPLTPRRMFSLLFIFSGAVLISGWTAIGKADVSAAGVLAGLSVPTLYAVWSLLGKKMRRDYRALPILTHAFGIAAVVLLPFQFQAPPPWPDAGATWLFFAGLVGLSTVGGFLVYVFGLGRLPAGVVTIVAMSEIVFSAVLASIYLNETLTWVEISGALLIAAGIAAVFSAENGLKTRKS